MGKQGEGREYNPHPRPYLANRAKFSPCTLLHSPSNRGFPTPFGARPNGLNGHL